jgi:hypothetical protein
MIARAHAAFAKGEFLNEFIPVPTDLTDTVSGTMAEDQREAHEAQQEANVEKYGYANWYDFCVNEWGTKWDFGSGDGINDVAKNSLTVYFESAWSPPIRAYEKLTDLGFTVEATYHEPGMAFVGSWEDGNDEYIEYGGEKSDTIRNLIGADLDDCYNISESMAEWEAENADEEE